MIFLFKKISLIFKGVFFLGLLFLFVNFSYAAVYLNAGDNITISINDSSLELNGSIVSDFCNTGALTYSRRIWNNDGETFGIYINQPNSLTGAVVNWNSTDPISGGYTVDLEMACNNIYIEDDTFILNIVESTPTINAGSDQSVTIGDTVSLNGTISGFPASGCNFSYEWFDDSAEVNISNSGSLTGASFETSSFTGTVAKNIGLRVNVSSTSMTHDSCGNTGIYSDNLYITIGEATPPTGGGGGGRSSYERYRDEADNIFRDDDLVNNLELFLTENDWTPYYYDINWNNLGGNGHIKYELQFSTGSSFDTYKSYETTAYNQIIVKYDIEEKDIYFFRVRAFYKEKYTKWSETLSVVNKDNLLNYFKVECKNCENNIGYYDVFDSVDLLIEKELNTECKYCNAQKVSFYDIWKSEDMILDELEISCENSSKKVNFEDSLETFNDYVLEPFDNYKTICPPIEKVDFNDLIK